MPPRIQGAGPSPQNRCSIAAKSTAEEKRERERERERESERGCAHRISAQGALGALCTAPAKPAAGGEGGAYAQGHMRAQCAWRGAWCRACGMWPRGQSARHTGRATGTEEPAAICLQRQGLHGSAQGHEEGEETKKDELRMREMRKGRALALPLLTIPPFNNENNPMSTYL